MSPGEMIAKEADRLRDEIERLVADFEEEAGIRVTGISVEHQDGEPFASVALELAP